MKRKNYFSFPKLFLWVTWALDAWWWWFLFLFATFGDTVKFFSPLFFVDSGSFLFPTSLLKLSTSQTKKKFCQSYSPPPKKKFPNQDIMAADELPPNLATKEDLEKRFQSVVVDVLLSDLRSSEFSSVLTSAIVCFFFFFSFFFCYLFSPPFFGLMS